MDLHVATRCENRAIECPYEKFGCCSPAEPITEKTFDAHARENCANHLFTVTSKVLPKLSVLEHEHVRIEKQLHEHLQANNRNHEKLKRHRFDDDDASKQRVKQKERRSSKRRVDEMMTTTMMFKRRLKIALSARTISSSSNPVNTTVNTPPPFLRRPIIIG